MKARIYVDDGVVKEIDNARDDAKRFKIIRMGMRLIMADVDDNDLYTVEKTFYRTDEVEDGRVVFR